MSSFFYLEMISRWVIVARALLIKHPQSMRLVSWHPEIWGDKIMPFRPNYWKLLPALLLDNVSLWSESSIVEHIISSLNFLFMCLNSWLLFSICMTNFCQVVYVPRQPLAGNFGNARISNQLDKCRNTSYFHCLYQARLLDLTLYW